MADLVGHDSFFRSIIDAEHNFVQTLHEASNFPTDQLRTVLCMLAAYPLAFLLKTFPNSPTLKHIYSISLGLFFCVYTLGRWSWLHSFGSSLVAYLILCFASPKVSHKLVFFWAMGYMTVSHIYRLYTDYMGWSLDFTGPQMLLTLKLSSIGWNYYDGVANKDVTDKQKVYAIKKLPTLLEFYGWVYFFPCLLAGPAFEISEYLNYIDKSMFKSVPENKNRKQEDYVIPSTWWPTLVVFGRSLLVSVGLVVGAMFFPQSQLLSQEFLSSPFYKKIILMHVIVALVRFKYYFAWLIAEGSCVASGLGYNGFDKTGNMLFDRCTNVVVLKIELPQNMRDLTTNWNMGTANWLRKYVYERVKSKNHLVPLLATYVTSAFWHGFYSGYYFFFITGGVLTEIGKEARRRIRPNFVKVVGEKQEVFVQPWKRVYDVVGGLLSIWTLSYSGIAFVLLTYENALIVWGNLMYCGHILLAIGFFGFRFIPSPRTSVVKKTE